MNLLQTARELEHYPLVAVDGEIGHVEACYFDELAWVIRYLLVNTGNWLKRRQLLISPVAVEDITATDKSVNIQLTREQIENSPTISADKVITRQYEIGYYQYYDWPPYWDLGEISYAAQVKTQTTIASNNATALRSTKTLKTYAMRALDGAIGYVDGLIIDTRHWVIQYLEVDTRHWCPGKHVLLSTGWIKEVRWNEQSMSVNLTREAIKEAPGFDPSKRVRRVDERQLFKHYRRPVYW